MCCISHVLSLLFMVVLCEGVLLVLSDSVEHPSASGWIPWYDRGGRGVAFAVQLHREVKPESGLVGIVNGHPCVLGIEVHTRACAHTHIHIYMAGRLSCNEAGQIRPHVLYQPCVAITFDGGAVRGCPPGTV